MREQIARDLHDDIGSNLGGIVLLSEMGRRHDAISPEARSDFAAIQEAAEGVINIVNENMFGALRMISVQQGYDPRYTDPLGRTFYVRATYKF